ncbi:hypothetical protein EDB19DRAFT_1716634 [Suillus lakei]|nr:hypothetical protein EDB19DRAFT_1716634 [Suillus lakei]
MRFAALVALTVVVSTVPGLAAPTPNSHLHVISKRDDNSIIHNLYPSKRSSVEVVGYATHKRDDDDSTLNGYPYERAVILPDWVVQGTSSDDTQGIASDTKRRSWNTVWTLASEGASSNDTQRQSDPVYITSPDNTKRQTEIAVNPLYDLEGASSNTKRQAESVVFPNCWDGVTEGTSCNDTKRQVESSSNPDGLDWY